MQDKKRHPRFKRHRRIRLRLYGDNERPRLVVHRSSKNISAQIIDDIKNKTLFSLSTYDKQIKKNFPYAGNIKTACAFGEIFAQKVKEKGFNKIIFDRAGYSYHGRIRAFAEALRKSGLEF